MKQLLPEANVTKLLLDSAHDTMPYYEYCRDHGIVPFIDLNTEGGCPPVYKDDFTINNDGVPVCRKATLCAGMEQKPQKGGQNLNVLKSALLVAMLTVPMKIHALMRNMARTPCHAKQSKALQ